MATIHHPFPDPLIIRNGIHIEQDSLIGNIDLPYSRRGPVHDTQASDPVKDSTLVVAGMLTLSAGTYAFRLSGRVLRNRVAFPPRAEQLLEAATAVMLAALVATTALAQGHGFAGFARPAGVLVGGVLAWRKAPFLAVVIAAAGTTAVLRLLGVP